MVHGAAKYPRNQNTDPKEINWISVVGIKGKGSQN